MADPSILAALVAHAKIVGSALCGGLIRILFRPARTRLQGAALVGACVATGWLGQPVASAYWGLPASYDMAVSFGLGLVGLSILNAALKAFDQIDAAGLIPERLRKRPRP